MDFLSEKEIEARDEKTTNIALVQKKEKLA